MLVFIYEMYNDALDSFVCVCFISTLFFNVFVLGLLILFFN